MAEEVPPQCSRRAAQIVVMELIAIDVEIPPVNGVPEYPKED